MARAGVATLIVVAILWLPAAARAQPVCDPSACDPGAAAAPPPRHVEPPSEAELEGVIAGGTTIAVASYLVGVWAAHGQPHAFAPVDDLPIVGALAAAARNPPGRNETPLLIFTAGAQAFGLALLATAASDLAALRRFSFDIGLGPGGCGASVTVRLP